MQEIIDPISIDLLKSELTADKKICVTNKADNEVYVVNHYNAPNVLREIGRIRELTFREAGGSSGLDCDLDEFDLMEKPYEQIVIWDPEACKIIGGYRYILGPDVVFEENGQPKLATAHMFSFSQHFIDIYLPHVIELGRAFVAPEYQSSKAGAKAIYALDNLWDGIGAVMLKNPEMFWFFGKITMYPDYDRSCRDLILHFMWKHFPDKENLITPINPELPSIDRRVLDILLPDEDFKSDFRNLKNVVRKLGSSIPPLFNSYMTISPTMRMLGTAVNEEFAGCEETAILVNFDEMYSDKRDRHKVPYIKQLFDNLSARFPLVNPKPNGMEAISGAVDKRRKIRFDRFLQFRKKK